MRRRPILLYLVLTLLLSWGFWVPWVMRAEGPFSAAQMQLLGAYGPAAAAVIVTALSGGLDGIRELLGRLLVWRAGIRWYLVALFLPAVLSLLNTTLYTMFGGDAPNFAEPPVKRLALASYLTGLSTGALILPLFVQQLIFGTTLGEEVGWRGFALEKLQQRQGALKASLWIGLLWVVWTLPLSWTPSEPGVMATRFALLLLGAMPASILASWIYNGTGGSLLLAVLFNNAVKVTDLFLTPSAGSPLFTIASFWILALVVLRLAGSNLGSRPPHLSRKAADVPASDSKLTSPTPP